MSQENVETVRRMLVSFRIGDLAAAWSEIAEMLDSQIEMDTTRSPMPGLAAVYRGPDDVARFWTDWAEAWGSLGEFEDPELLDAGDQVLIWFSQHEMRGKGSEIAIRMPEYGWLFRVRNRKFVRATMYMDRVEALEAAGLSE